MIKEELKKLFNADVQPFEKNDITTSVLSDFDNLILDLIDEEKFSSEILDVYKRFVVMKQGHLSENGSIVVKITSL